MRIKFLTSSPRDVARPLFDEQDVNDQFPFIWGSVSVCVSLMSRILILELYYLICSLVTSNRIGKLLKIFKNYFNVLLEKHLICDFFIITLKKKPSNISRFVRKFLLYFLIIILLLFPF